jgi:hypothetical protein
LEKEVVLMAAECSKLTTAVEQWAEAGQKWQAVHIMAGVETATARSNLRVAMQENARLKAELDAFRANSLTKRSVGVRVREDNVHDYLRVVDSVFAKE